ncbi:MAG: Fic family protein [Candidatus Cloacimonetes bacterium]|nr:Fic family protein [Candidatus Cloacimonadota bacterium]
MFQPKFAITPRILGNLTEIAEIKAIVERSKVLPQREALLRRKAVIKIAHTSTSIEGNVLQEFEVEKVLGGQKILAKENQIKEVKNLEKALAEVNKLAENKKTFDVKNILKIHRLVINGLVEPKKCGAFRPGNVFVVNEIEKKEQIVYTAPKAKEVPQLVNELCHWAKKAHAENEPHPILAAGLLHYQFATIHPFTDGNGRVTRLLTQLYLYQNNHDFRKILVLENYYNQNRQAYFAVLQTGETYPSREGADLTGWLEYFTNGFLFEARQVKEQIFSIGFQKELATTDQVLLSRDEIKLMDFAATMGQIKSPGVAEILSIPLRTAQAKLKELTDKGLLAKRGKGPASHYVLKSSY